jgi:hypothetical protein
VYSEVEYRTGDVAYLSPDVVHQAVHAGLHAERVLAWQQFRVSVAIEADGACQELFKLLHVDKSKTVSAMKIVNC